MSTKKPPKAPLDLQVLATEVTSAGDNTPVFWEGQKFPKAFYVGILLEDLEHDVTGKVWALRCRVEFTTEPTTFPVLSDLSLTGTWKRRRWRNGSITFPEPLIWNEIPTGTSLQLWQVRYVSENFHVLRRAALEIAAFAFFFVKFETFPEGTRWSGNGDDYWQRNNPKPVLKDFGKKVDKWQGRKVLTDDLLHEVARVYLAEVTSPLDGVKAKPPLRLEEHFGRPRPTIDRWIREATERGFLPPAEAGKVRKPKKQRGKRNDR